MKKILVPFLALLCLQVTAQREEREDDEQLPFINRVFVGGGVNIGFGTGFVALGALPEIGYSPAKWVDVGIATGINYNSQRYDYGTLTGATYSERIRATTFSIGPFVRLYPIPQIFATLQPEANWQTIKYSNTLSSLNDQSYKQNSVTCLAGVGYTSREVGATAFYIMLAADIAGDPNSPYRRTDNSFVPIIRSGFNIYLGRKGRY